MWERDAFVRPAKAKPNASERELGCAFLFNPAITAKRASVDPHYPFEPQGLT